LWPFVLFATTIAWLFEAITFSPPRLQEVAAPDVAGSASAQTRAAAAAVRKERTRSA
jgi:hypothetical protein